jgi:hypothetical protein
MRWHDVSVVLFAVAMTIMLFRRGTVQMLIEQIENFTGNFRGGPPTPMHPLPSDDRRFLLRRAHKNRDDNLQS